MNLPSEPCWHDCEGKCDRFGACLDVVEEQARTALDAPYFDAQAHEGTVGEAIS